MEITKEKLLDRLNGDLAWEYAALIQSVQHASVITCPGYESMIQELLVHTNEEMQHAIALSEQVNSMPLPAARSGSPRLNHCESTV